MREILFRGKKLDGEWVEGFYYIATSGYAGSDEVIGKPCHMITTGRWQASGAYGERNELAEHKVNPETVGQYTGLTDKNGKRIFEGDIVLFPWHNEDKEVFCIEFVEGEFMAIPKRKSTDIWCIRIGSYSPDFEVIGNIHDNPKLLEAE